MHFPTLIVAFTAAAANAAPLLQRHVLSGRDDVPSLPTVDMATSRIVEMAGTPAALSRRAVAVPAVSNNRIVELEGAAASTAANIERRDELPALPVVDAATNHVLEVAASSSSSKAKREVAVPVLTRVSNKIMELVGATNSRRAPVAAGVVPVVVDGSRVMAMDMLAEDIAN